MMPQAKREKKEEKKVIKLIIDTITPLIYLGYTIIPLSTVIYYIYSYEKAVKLGIEKEWTFVIFFLKLFGLSFLCIVLYLLLNMYFEHYGRGLRENYIVKHLPSIAKKCK